jgi:hypothetical protein
MLECYDGKKSLHTFVCSSGGTQGLETEARNLWLSIREDCSVVSPGFSHPRDHEAPHVRLKNAASKTLLKTIVMKFISMETQATITFIRDPVRHSQHLSSHAKPQKRISSNLTFKITFVFSVYPNVLCRGDVA